MARFVHREGSTSSSFTSRTPHAAGHTQGSSSIYTAPDDSAEFADSTSYKVENSPAYRNAFALFSNEPNKIWLQRLMAIPNSVQDATETWTDQLGITTNYKDKQAANYQYCIEQINALVAEYQQWKNSLPETQVQQMADAGINAAITGNGVNASQIPAGNAPTVNPSSMQSAQPIDFLSGAASFILDASSGLASIASQFKQLGISSRTQQFNEQHALLDFRKYARENGMQIPAESTWQDILTGSWIDPAGDSNKSNAYLRKLLTHHQNGAVIGALASLYPDAADWFLGSDGNKYATTGISSVPVGIDATTTALLEMYKNQKAYELTIKKYDSLIVGENYKQEQDESISVGRRRAITDYQEKQEKIKSDLLDTLSKSDDPTDKLLLMKILWQNTINSVELERKQNEFFTTGLNLGPLGTIDIMPK